ncbi:MAG: GntR family transcriptional regulator [Muribaculaceae bacterium]|nr:GntR family transcriptional regulator [Roseburia sp.]MCM1431260.1 GntR family transcriptional regulator [Muribaculaceae bacterium]MCM1492254.1 GntR family transcriptional regulator [Muribaculaceae bacterium]
MIFTAPECRGGRSFDQQIKENIKRLVQLKAILPGESLLPERELAARLAVNPRRVEQVYQELEWEGYLCRTADGAVLVADSHLRERERREELMETFDGVVKELFGLSVSEQELAARIGVLEKGDRE